MKRKRNITKYIIVATMLGIAAGYACHSAIHDSGVTKEIAGYLSLLNEVFLRLVKMVIAPLVFATLTVGIAQMGDGNAVGRVGVRAFGWFSVASFTSLLTGLLVATILEPGGGQSIEFPKSDGDLALKTNALTLKEFVVHLVPRSIVEAMANNEVLQVVIFSIFLGTALAALGEAGRRLTRVIDDVAQVMLQVTSTVMWFAPIAVFASLAATVSTGGLDVLVGLARFIASFYLALALLWGLLALAGLLFLGRRVSVLIRLIRDPFFLSFATASSEAAYPKLLDALDRFGVNRKISSFVLPMGYSFNLDGSMMYCTFAVLFIAQVYGIDLSLGTQITMLLLLMVTSKGMAGVPRASLVVIAATLNQFNLPEAGLVLIMAVDVFLDMGRSATNAVGNSIATAVIAKWEGQLDDGDCLECIDEEVKSDVGMSRNTSLELRPKSSDKVPL
ncbi:dicarboxylate/amino acid:cation symporter [Caballeronia sp. EK]|uniref:dicarboxylate/amino acid:cation symporter n=1 Tax=Caballeronia sp. EK TaxID=2767469 RepID=UPI0016568091|nr:dicarboxylate/amino acid:cation symporter [Caballeronia sp. EK]MBC8642009.1 dicarboxylate/amino acid:cation symporter [Caballeronia sp. EK]